MNQVITKIPETICHCGYKMTATVEIGNDNTPVGGDLSLCAGCARLWVFNDDLTQREPTAEEREAMLAEPHIRKAIALVKGGKI